MPFLIPLAGAAVGLVGNLLKPTGGPSSAMMNIANQQSNLASQLDQNYTQSYGEQQGIFNTITRSMTPTVAAGPSQLGFSAPELAALNTQAINSAGAAAANAQQKTQVGEITPQEGRFGGNQNGLESGVNKAISAGQSSISADALAAQQLGITVEDYQQGNLNYENAVKGLSDVANLENPTALANASTNASKEAFSAATGVQAAKVQQQQNQFNAVAGPVEGAITGGIDNLDTSGGSSFGEQAANFFAGTGGGYTNPSSNTTTGPGSLPPEYAIGG